MAAGDLAAGDLAAALMSSPAGVALLAHLEAEQRADAPMGHAPVDSRPAAVGAACDAVGAMSFGALVARAVVAADRIAGPWMSDAPDQLVLAFGLAQSRVAIAEAIVARFGAELGAGFDPTAQQWWASAFDPGRLSPRFVDRGEIYCCGEFTFGGIWTVTDPPAEVHGELIGVWELWPEPASRWRLPVDPSARMFEIHGPADWVRLVTMHPRRVDGAHSGWELPGVNQRAAAVRGVVAASAGAAARLGVAVAMPDWTSVAGSYDGVHLSWAGMITGEGHVVPVPELGPSVVTMLRYWRSERTLWLRDGFGPPEALLAPVWPENGGAVASAVDDPMRRAADERALAALLGRDPFRPAGPAS